MKHFAQLFFAQAASHTLWYLSARGVVAHNTAAVVITDTTYCLLNLLVLRACLHSASTTASVLAVCAGGAFGTWVGMVLPFFAGAL